MKYEIEFVNDGNAVGWRALRLGEKVILGEIVAVRKTLGKALHAYPSGAMAVIQGDVKFRAKRPVFEIKVT